MEVTLRGIPVAPGIAIGPAVVLDAQRLEIPQYEISDAAAELLRFDEAVSAARAEIRTLYEQTLANLGDAHAKILQAQLFIADDPALRAELEQQLAAECANIEFLLDRQTRRYAQVMEKAEDPLFRERAADLYDVAHRILGHLMKRERLSLATLSRASLVVGHELHPADAAALDRSLVLGLALDTGSTTSHTAILARALGIPTVMGLEHFSALCPPNVTVIVDGTRGVAVVNPVADTVSIYEAERRRLEEQRRLFDVQFRGTTNRTLDGHHIPLQANIELPVEISPTLKTITEGIGLYRTEYLFLNRTAPPGEEEQYRAYTHAATMLQPHSVTLRTMDIGGDKFVSYMQHGQENNPQMGWRAVRFCLERLDIFKTQLRAMLRASAHGNVQIMFPMISGLEELRQVKAVLANVRTELDAEGIAYNHDLKIGSMIEVPSAVAITDWLADECDFFSIGTNDLVQYSLAVDRENARIAHLYQPGHPAVLRMLRVTARAAAAKGIPCSLCGEMAGDPTYTHLLIGLGITSLSMSAISLPLVRAKLVNSTMDECRLLAEEALTLRTATEVKQLLLAHHHAQNPDQDLRMRLAPSFESPAT